MKIIRILGFALIVIACLSGLMLSDLPAYLKVKKGDVVNFNEVKHLSLEKNDLVAGNADFVLSCIAEEYETSFGIRSSSNSTKRFYILNTDEDNYIVYATADEHEYKKLDTMVDECTAFYNSYSKYQESGDYEDLATPTTVLALEGVVTKMPSEVEGYFREWYGEPEGTSTFDTECEPLMITHREMDGYGTTVIIGACLAALFVVLGIITLMLWRKEKNSNIGY